MTNEEKDLLFKDLSARLPYKPYLEWDEGRVIELNPISYETIARIYFQSEDNIIRPYLRPMSSMTEKEKQEYDKAYDIDLDECAKSIKIKLETGNSDSSGTPMFNHIDWLNQHMFDYRGLISMGLALEAPEGMYDLKKITESWNLGNLEGTSYETK